MRSNQQNKRSRNRGNNNRKNQNPLTRSYESNGPDVRIRGTAQHVADKYLQLARDAHSSGDSVGAENYLQHAEHYLRIISTAQAQQQARQEGNERRGKSEETEPLEVEVADRFAASTPSSSDNDESKGSEERNGKAAESEDGEKASASEGNSNRRERRPRRRPRASAAENGSDDAKSNGAAKEENSGAANGASSDAPAEAAAESAEEAPSAAASELPSFVTKEPEAKAAE